MLSVNPAASRTINSLPELLTHLYNAIAALMGFPLGDAVGSPAEHFMHTMSLALFVLIYCIVCWRAVRGTLLGGRFAIKFGGRPRTLFGGRLATKLGGRSQGSPLQGIATVPGLVRWMALVWLLFCAIGSPWYWPWYIVTFFGLYAVVEAVSNQQNWTIWTRLLTFSTLSIYCFIAWGLQHAAVPGLPGFIWAFFGGLWIWALPFLGLTCIHWRSLMQNASLHD